VESEKKNHDEEIEGRRLKVLLDIYTDLRKEVEQRISQRDSFAIQFIVAVGALLSLGVQNNKFSPFLVLLIPLITLFYALQIFYSYSIHDSICDFIKNNIEPTLASLMDVAPGQAKEYLWETHNTFNRKLRSQKAYGIRKGFFKIIIFVMPVVASAIYFLLTLNKNIFSETDRGYDMMVNGLIAGLTCLVFLVLSFFALKKTDNKYDFSKLGLADYKAEDDGRTKKAVFLDRDGTIIVDKDQTFRPETIEFIPGAVSSLKKLQNMGFSLFILTNQDGIAQKKYTAEQMHKFNAELLKKLSAEGVNIKAIYYSPDLKDSDHLSFKPNPGMIYLAQIDYSLDIEHSYMVGDQVSDYLCGVYGGVKKSLMVTTGLYKNPTGDYKESPQYKEIKPTTLKDLSEAVSYIEKEEKE
jgi:D-glycero-D-manno-heptose 1,7-bisphosphate phosphatase